MSEQPQAPNEAAGSGQPVIHRAVASARQPAGGKAPWLTPLRTRALAMGALLVLVLAFSYFVWYKPSQPDMALANALMKSMQAESAKVRLETVGGGKGEAKLIANGGYNSKGAFSLAGSYMSPDGKLGFDIRSIDGQDIYAKVTGLNSLPALLGPEAGTFGAGQADIVKALENTWLIVPKSATDSLLKDSQAGAAPTKLSESDRRVVVATYQQYPFLHVSEVGMKQVVDGTDCQQYKVGVDKVRLKSFAAEIEAKLPALAASAKQLKSVDDKDLPSQPFDVLVAKDSGYLKQFTYHDGKHKSGYQVTLSDFGQPVTVEKPQNAKQFFEALSGAVFSGMPLPQ